MTDSKPLRAAIYARISADLEQEGKGVTRQIKDCTDLATKNGWIVTDEYVDNDVSAVSVKVRRPEYERLQEDMRAGGLDVVVVWAPDRLLRQPRQLEDWVDLCNETGIAIHSVNAGTFDLSNPYGIMIARQMTTFAAFEVSVMKKRIERKHLELAEQGAWPGKRVYGFEKDATVIQSEADIIRELADRVLAGEGYNAIARDLNERAVPTVTGSQWRATTIIDILRAPRIAGLRVHRGEVVAKGSWEPIISEELSSILRARLAPGRSQGTRGGPRKHLLVGILKCGRCGSGMVRGLAGRTKTPTYRCPANQGAAACGRMTVVAHKMDEWATEQVLTAVQLNKQEREPDAGEWLRITRELAVRREQLGADYADGLIDRETVIAGTKAIREQEAKLEPPKVSRPRLAVTEERLRAAWPHMTVSEQRSIMETLLERVTVNPVIITTGAKRFDSRRFDVVWKA